MKRNCTKNFLLKTKEYKNADNNIHTANNFAFNLIHILSKTIFRYCILQNYLFPYYISECRKGLILFFTL